MSQQAEITSHAITLDGERLAYSTSGDPASSPNACPAPVWLRSQTAVISPCTNSLPPIWTRCAAF